MPYIAKSYHSRVLHSMAPNNARLRLCPAAWSGATLVVDLMGMPLSKGNNESIHRAQKQSDLEMSLIREQEVDKEVNCDGLFLTELMSVSI